MKYIKLFMLLVAATVFAACSDDDSWNSKEVTVGFDNPTLSIKENSGLVNIPINVKGLRNGDIALVIKAEETGDNPAVEDVNYLITDKTLNLKADDLEEGVVNIELKTIDDQEINENRTLKLIITDAKGATIENNEITITLRDNDAAFYEKFFGTWTLNATEYNGSNKPATPFTAKIKITGPNDEADADYNNILYASSAGMFDVGVSLDCEWRFAYSFDMATKTGSLDFICGDLVASYASSFQWTWVGVNAAGTNYSFDDIKGPWALGEGDAFPTTISWGNKDLLLYRPGQGAWVWLYDITITKD